MIQAVIKRLWEPRGDTGPGLRIREGFLDEGHIQDWVLNESVGMGMGCRPTFHGEATHERLRGVRGLEVSVKYCKELRSGIKGVKGGVEGKTEIKEVRTRGLCRVWWMGTMLGHLGAHPTSALDLLGCLS